MAEYSEPGILKDTKNIQNGNFGGNQVRCMQVVLSFYESMKDKFNNVLSCQLNTRAQQYTGRISYCSSAVAFCSVN